MVGGVAATQARHYARIDPVSMKRWCHERASPGSEGDCWPVFGALHELPAAELDHVVHLDRQSQLALLAETRVADSLIVIGEARYALSPDGLECEFALSVADDWRGMRLGTLLMADIECRVRTLGASGGA